MEYEGNQPIRVLLPEELESYSLTGTGDFPRMAKADIDDKSKGDAISKGVVILQTSWFVMQCIARGAQGLPITELELVTVAFATLNFVTYLLWWDKPLNVQRGVRLYKKRPTEEPIDDGHAETTSGFWGALRGALSELPASIFRGPYIEELDEQPWLVRVLAWPVYKPLQVMDDEEVKHTKRVNTFYPRKSATTSLTVFIVIAIASAFGGIHCTAWSFTFPSDIERTLWRVASVSITSVPIMVVPLALVVDRIPVLDDFEVAGGMIILLPLFLYVLGRLALLILPLLCLRSLPSAAYHVVHWTSFIPHV
jgi:hypothetical protein